ncbi:MAG: CbtA family protein [Solirubrobacterales bacterium]|nr:CbtA family protein [Solirubrobacterales bacterium]
MVRQLLVGGMLVGLGAGLLAFAFAYVVGEPQVQRAIDFGDHQALLRHEPAELEIVSRGVQRTLGLLTGTVVPGIALGGMFSLVFAWAYGRIGAMSPRLTALVLAAAAYLTVTVIPFTKYPANPPAVGDPATIDRRTVLYFAMIAISLLALIAASRIRRELLSRVGPWNAAITAAAALIVVVAAAESILPAVHDTPAAFPADVLYGFRLASLGTNLTLWAVIGLGFGATAERMLAPADDRRLGVAASRQAR